MHYDDIPLLLYFFKALADDKRMQIIGLLGTGERSVGDLAQALGLAESTTSHHLSKLHSAGVLTLRQQGNQRFYRVNRERFEQALQEAAHLPEMRFTHETSEDDTAWIDALEGFDEDERKVLRTYTRNGKLTQLPRKVLKHLAVLRWLATHFMPDRRYSEKEVNAIISAVHPDYATLRRDLVEYGYMRRQKGGGDYWLVPDEDAG
ncbi:metalloregulator ArsR/SmtB family transcription factor [bacterium]|nr:metalloregulator ArsR/SmtB family transcription factor [bacterium]